MRRNLILAVVLFGLWVLTDFIAIHEPSAAIEQYVLLPLYLASGLAPLPGFWFANAGTFISSNHPHLFRLAAAIACTVVFTAVSILPLIWIHEALGGSI